MTLSLARDSTPAVTFGDFARRLRESDLALLKGSDYRALNRELKSLTDGPEVRIAYLGNVTLGLLPPYPAVHGAREGWRIKSYIGNFGQHFQALHDAEMSEFAPEIIMLALSLPLLRPDAMAHFTGLTPEGRRALCTDVLGEVESWVKQALAATSATLLVGNFPLPSAMGLGIADTAELYGETAFYFELNLELLRRMRGYSRVQVLDLQRIASRIGHERAFDTRLLHISKTDWTEAMMAAVGREIARHVVAAKGAAKKCLALDIDNTLWGGVVGEEGPMGVKIGHGDAESEAYLAFQQRIRSLKDRGILLALCSKNNPEDVDEAFRLRPEMPLNADDFSARAVSWEPKHLGLTQIAAELNIGIDAIVFVDDNPAEVALIRQKLPQVECLLLPPDPADFAAALDNIAAFEKSVVLPDDIGKARQYREEAERMRFSAEHDNMEDYLAQLQMEVTIAPVDAGHLPRVHQMFSKTNQFNVTTRRYGLGELETMLASPRHHLGMVALRDRFGDLGIIAAFVLIEDGERLHIDSLLMSCRAMGRGVETAIMNYIKQAFAEREELSQLTAEFIPTPKNKPAANYFAEQDFQPAGEAAGSLFMLDKGRVNVKPCHWIKTKGTSLWKKTLKEFA
jgi:FkbH-like protein